MVTRLKKMEVRLVTKLPDISDVVGFRPLYLEGDVLALHFEMG